MRRGVTLFELLVVLSILALLAAATIPALSGAARVEPLNESAVFITSLLSRARLHAVRNAVDVQLQLDSASRRYWVVAFDVPPKVLLQGPLQLAPGTTLDLPSRRTVVDFSGFGSVEGPELVVRHGALEQRIVPRMVVP